MNRTALIYEGLSLDWFGVMVAAACLVGLCVTCLLRKFQKGSVNEILTVFCIGAPLALILSRLQYCLLRSDVGISYIFKGMHQGGYGLYGAMLGILAAIGITALLFKVSFSELTDCVAAAGAGIIAVGRFATRFTMDDLGFEIAPNVFTVEEAGLTRLAVFYLDGIVESVIFVLCIGLFFFSYCRKNSTFTKGNVALIFLMLHGLSQVVMDSLRTTTHCLFNNDFVKASQIIGIVSWLVIIIMFVCRLVKKQLFRKEFWGIFAVFAVLIVVSIRMEYRVGAGNYISAHMVMGICMVIMAVLSLIIVGISEKKSKAVPAAEVETESVPAANKGVQPVYSFGNDVLQAENNSTFSFDSPAPIQTADSAQGNDFELDNDFDYAYESINNTSQPDDTEFEDDFDYMYEEIAATDVGQPLNTLSESEQDYPLPVVGRSPAPAQVSSTSQGQHRISNDTLDELRRQLAEMDNL